MGTKTNTIKFKHRKEAVNLVVTTFRTRVGEDILLRLFKLTTKYSGALGSGVSSTGAKDALEATDFNFEKIAKGLASSMDSDEIKALVYDIISEANISFPEEKETIDRREYELSNLEDYDEAFAGKFLLLGVVIKKVLELNFSDFVDELKKSTIMSYLKDLKNTMTSIIKK